MIEFRIIHPKGDHEMLGAIPYFFDEADPRSAKAQLDANYGPIGGKWKNVAGFEMRESSIKYSTDPERPLVAEAKLHDETIRFYVGAWIAIVQPDGSFEIDRID